MYKVTNNICVIIASIPFLDDRVLNILTQKFTKYYLEMLLFSNVRLKNLPTKFYLVERILFFKIGVLNFKY